MRAPSGRVARGEALACLASKPRAGGAIAARPADGARARPGARRAVRARAVTSRPPVEINATTANMRITRGRMERSESDGSGRTGARACDGTGGGAPRSRLLRISERIAARDSRPTIPSTSNPSARWNRSTARSVLGPKRPSMGPDGYPRRRRRRCTSRTRSEPPCECPLPRVTGPANEPAGRSPARSGWAEARPPPAAKARIPTAKARITPLPAKKLTLSDFTSAEPSFRPPLVDARHHVLSLAALSYVPEAPRRANMSAQPSRPSESETCANSTIPARRRSQIATF
jgi:hypothetical protein